MPVPAHFRCRPWRSAALGWLVTAAFLVVGVPLFLRMPLWCDVTLYAVAAQVVSGGGVHYRDVFDTNPPGFMWLLCGVRGLLGTSSEALRAADLFLVVTVVAGLLWLARKAGASCVACAWSAAAMAAFYPFVHEFNHVQRDVWMMLPAGLAIALRLKRAERAERVLGPGLTPTAEVSSPPPLAGEGGGASPPGEGALSQAGTAKQPSNKSVTPHPARKASLPSPARGEGKTQTNPQRVSYLHYGRNNGFALLEGLLWGIGCWIKPHLLIVSAVVWLVTFRELRVRDSLAVFAGVVVAGAAGFGRLVASGAWPYFLDIWRTWNADYLATVFRELPFRVVTQLDYFPPYSACALIAVPLAVANLRTRNDEPYALRRKALAAVYLTWLFTALFFQRPFHYVHVPETLLMIALFAANRWPIPFALVALQILAGVWFTTSGQGVTQVPPHPAFDANRTRWWAVCLDREPPREVRRGVAMWVQHFGGIDPVELGAVADYLREQNVRDRELIAWHDSPHALYLDLGVKPGFRFMHVGTAAGLGTWQEQVVLRELQAAIPHARLVVSDIHRVTEKYAELNDLDADGFPKVLPAWQRREFPFDQPVIFRSPSGRYLVHRIEKPVASARIPKLLDQAEPKKE